MLRNVRKELRFFRWPLLGLHLCGMPSDETADDGKKSCDSLILANEQSASPIMSGTAPEYRTKGTCGFIMIARAREPVIAVRTKYPSFSRVSV